eukprot:scaffold298898_cov33-Tisochrysis_lutea.AAC.3
MPFVTPLTTLVLSMTGDGPAAPPSQLLVLGMHHAGTSIVANMTMMLGAYGGKREDMLFHPTNPLKYWERADVVRLNEARLAAGIEAAAVRYDVPQWMAYGFNASKPAVKVSAMMEARNIVNKLNAKRPWVTKDPRMALVAKEWIELLDAPACVVVHREPLSMVNSLMIYSPQRFVRRVGIGVSGLLRQHRALLRGRAHRRRQARRAYPGALPDACQAARRSDRARR